MKLTIEHRTQYEFSRPIFLEPHVVRLTPRSDPAQRLVDWRLEVEPKPMARSLALDAEGNSVEHLWFAGVTDKLSITAAGVVETLRTNPYDYLLADPALRTLPLDYAADERLERYLEYDEGEPAVAAWTEQALEDSERGTIDFLQSLNQRLYGEVQSVVRETGLPLTPQQTLTERVAACRDVAVAFVACCRRAGLAARFVSGYQEGDPDTEHRQLHAWAEVYLPGGGWRGYDPTHGLLVAEGHVALAAAPRAAGAAPMTGSFRGTGVSSTMRSHLALEASA